MYSKRSKVCLALTMKAYEASKAQKVLLAS